MRLVCGWLAAVVVLAGCSAPAATVGTEVVVKSMPQEVRSNATSGVPVNAPPRAYGHITGVVVDQAIRPLPGAVVHLPGMDLSHDTARDGSFSFTDLYPGAYFLTATAEGHEVAETVVQVEPDQFVRVKFILKALPPPTPHHETQKFTGYADLTGTVPFFTGSPTCGSCRFTLQTDPAAEAFVLEAAMDPTMWAGLPGSGNSFQYYAAPEECCDSYLSGEGPNPLRLTLRPEVFGNETSVRLDMVPGGFPLPESSKTFEVFFTSWYNAEPPSDWSIVAGKT